MAQITGTQSAPAAFGTPGSLGYVDPFAAKMPEKVDPGTQADITGKFNTIVSGLNAYKSTQTAPPKEPAVVSSQGADQQITDAQKKIADMSSKGTKVDEKGGTVYADGATVPAVEGATYNTKTGQYEPTDPTGGDYGAFYGTDTGTPSPEYSSIEKQFAPLKATLDANTLAQVNAIQQQYEGLKANQIEANAASTKSATAGTITGGSARYAPLDAKSITLASISTGLGKISDLDAKENAALASAKNAGATGDQKLMTEMTSQAETIRKEKQTQADTVMKAVQKANSDLQTEREQIQKDNAVAQMLASGETDPAKIMAAINKAGLSMTADEVKKSLTALTPTATKSTDTYKFTQSNVGKMLASGMTTAQIQQVQDHYNGNGDAPVLDEKQVAAVQQVLSGITPKAPKADTGGGVIQSGKIVATQSDIDQGTKALKDSASQGKEADGKYADPNVYLKMYEHWMNSGGKQADFFKYYPFSQHINPENTWLAQSISDFNNTGSSSGEQAP